MGATMDPTLLKAGVAAHHKAVGSVSQAKPVLSQADFEAVNAAIGRMIASVPESQTMDLYNTFAALVSPNVPPISRAFPGTPTSTSSLSLASRRTRLSRPST